MTRQERVEHIARIDVRQARDGMDNKLVGTVWRWKCVCGAGGRWNLSRDRVVRECDTHLGVQPTGPPYVIVDDDAD